MRMTDAPKIETATFAAGCFWGVEETFRTTPGVLSTEVGYTGGTTKHPSYEDVCSHTTGHAEAVNVTYDPSKVSFQELLELFWSLHDPTQGNRQGPDVGDQYRSGVFVHNKEQRAEAEAALKNEQKNHKKTVTTEITDAPEFWRAEEYHQQYSKKNGGAACHIVKRKAV